MNSEKKNSTTINRSQFCQALQILANTEDIPIEIRIIADLVTVTILERKEKVLLDFVIDFFVFASFKKEEEKNKTWIKMKEGNA